VLHPISVVGAYSGTRYAMSSPGWAPSPLLVHNLSRLARQALIAGYELADISHLFL